MNILSFFHRKPTANERLERMTRERRESFEIQQFARRRAAAKLGHERRKALKGASRAHSA